MAKRKKRKEEKPAFTYTSELTGLILVIVGIVGFGDFGIVGNFFKNFAIFLCGSYWFIFLASSLVLGLYMVFKRNAPNFLDAKLIGVYVIIISILMLAHQNYIGERIEFNDIVKTTFDNVAVSFKDGAVILTEQELSNTGGGMIGAIFAASCALLFGKTGSYVVIVILLIFGVVMLFNTSLKELLLLMLKPFKRHPEDKDKDGKKKDPLIKFSDDNEEDSPEAVVPKKVIASPVEAPSNNEPVINMPDEVKDEKTLEIHDNTKEYKLPPMTILDPIKSKGKVNSTEQINWASQKLLQVFSDFGIEGAKMEQVSVGPAVTQYEMSLKSGTRVSRVLSIDKEIALALGAKDVRIEAPIPGKQTIGIEIPNPEVASVQIKEVLSKVPPKYENSKLLAALGKDIMGNVKFLEVNKMPHLLVAGATGSGKSVCMNAIIVSILMRTTPDEVRIVLVDPKKVEMAPYEGIPHLLVPVVTDPKKASATLQKIVAEMDDRFLLFSETGTKNIQTYNDLMIKKNHPEKKMPYIVVIIDELADLMVVAQKEVETSIMRLAQLARAAGIHMILATQRPSTNVITGVIKANIPSRISFAVSSQVDSRTILDHKGAEKLLGKGDMLYAPMGENTPVRIQGCFITDEEVERITNFWKEQGSATYDDKFKLDEDKEEAKSNIEGMSSSGNNEDPLFNEVKDFAIRSGKISASLIQRKFSVGYNRAARLIDILEEEGIIGPQNGSKPREVLVTYGETSSEE